MPRLNKKVAEADSWKNIHTEPARSAFGIRKLLSDFQYSIGAPERCPFPVIAAVHGPVVGLGIDIISYCDIRHASSGTTFSIKVTLNISRNFEPISLVNIVLGGRRRSGR